jgi:hypothetical protein
MLEESQGFTPSYGGSVGDLTLILRMESKPKTLSSPSANQTTEIKSLTIAESFRPISYY